jgi:hypothetical protein
MSFSVSGNLVLLALLVPIGLVFAIATVPRWLIRSMSKHALWRLRDKVVDDTLAGALPSDHPAVRELIERLEWAISESRSFDLLHLIVWNRAKRQLHPKVLQGLSRVPELTDLTPDRAKRVNEYRSCYDSVAIRALLLSSWIGIAIVLWTAIPLAFKVLVGSRKTEYAHQRSLPGGLRVVIRVAAEEVAEDTKLGRQAREFVNEKGPALEPAPAVA